LGTVARRLVTCEAAIALAIATACAAQPCATPVVGTAEAWRHKGQFEGYRVESGCPDSPVVVAGGGKRWLDDTPPGDPTRKRLVAITKFYTAALEPHREKLRSWNGFSHGRTCLPEGEYPVIVLADWRDVDTAARLAGEALAAGGLAERVGIRLAPFTCSAPTEETAHP
jgi:hypothetical protein